MHPSSPLPFCHQSSMLSCCPPMGTAWSLLLWQADWRGQPGRHGWPLVCLVAGPCLVQRLLITGGRGWGRRCLAAETWLVPGLVLAHWWVEQCSGMGGYRAKGSQI